MLPVQGCGSCEATKMRRRAFKYAVAKLDPTEPKIGDWFVFDVLELRVPSVDTRVQSSCTSPSRR